MFSFLAPFKIYLIFALVIAIMGGLSFWYYKDSQATIAGLNKALTAQELITSEQKRTIETMEKNEEVRRYVMDQYYKEIERSRTEIATLEERLREINPETGEDSTINESINRDVNAMEDKINREWNNAQKCFELYSGVKIEKLETTKDGQTKLLRDCGLPWDSTP